jgi:hypothetical protein
METSSYTFEFGWHGGHRLLLPKEFFAATEEERKEHAGGCGPGGWGDWLVPDTIIGVDIQPACEGHDWMYYWGISKEDKDIADLCLLWNGTWIIISRHGLLDIIRLRHMMTYFQAVSTLGEKAFLNGKPGFQEAPVKSVPMTDEQLEVV